MQADHINDKQETPVEVSDFLVSESDKEKPEYLMAMTDLIITRNVDENSEYRKRMFKMRDFYDGIRDPMEYAYLEDNYGIGNPSEIKFTPLMRNRIDVLIGLMSATEFDYKVSVTDKKSLFEIEQQKSDAIFKEVMDKLNMDIKKTGEQEEKPKALTPIERIYAEAESDALRKWRNPFIEAATDFIEDSREDPVINLRRVREVLFTDIAVVGQCNYRVQAKEMGIKPNPKALLPENCYYTIRRDMDNANECPEFVYVKYMSKRDILQEYGHFMDDDEKADVLDIETVKLGDALPHYQTLQEYHAKNKSNNRKLKSAIDRYMLYGADQDVVKVYEVEWKANNPYEIDSDELSENLMIQGPDKIQKKRWRQDLYRSVRIGEKIYLDMGKDTSAVRYDSDPDKVFLTFNGAHYSDRGGEPYSILWKGKDIQDMHDILLFHRDNIIANSGVRGTNLDFASIPTFLGDTEMERVMKAWSLIKQGLNVTDNTQDGNEFAGQNGGKGGYDLTVNGESLKAINETIQSLDEEASRITGVTQAMLGAIEQREAVSNVKVGINQSSLVLKGIFDTHDRIMRYLFTDLINAAKQTIPEDGYHGSYQEGRKIFTIMPKNFSMTNYRLQVINSSQEKMKVDEAKALIHEAMATQAVPIDLGLKVIMMDNPTEIIELAAEVAEKHSGLAKQLEEATKSNEELQKQLEQLQKEIDKYDQEKAQLERDKVSIQDKLANAKISNDGQELKRKVSADQDDRMLKERALDLEEEEMRITEDSNRREIRNNIV